MINVINYFLEYFGDLIFHSNMIGWCLFWFMVLIYKLKQRTLCSVQLDYNILQQQHDITKNALHRNNVLIEKNSWCVYRTNSVKITELTMSSDINKWYKNDN